MIELILGSGDEGRKLGRYLEKLLPKAPRSFVFKALRQNKVRVDGKHAKEAELMLHAGMKVTLYLTDEQLAEFGYHQTKKEPEAPYHHIPILYEDENILAVCKPVGMLSQKSTAKDVSLTECMRQYLKDKGEWPEGTYEPAFVHRLDRNTEGVMLMAKTLQAARALSEMIKERQIDKIYLAAVSGQATIWKQETELKDFYRKDRKQNMASVEEYREKEEKTRLENGWEICRLKVRMIAQEKDASLLRVELLTGKSHQIRAQLSHHGYPILADGKYGGREKDGKTYSQMLLAAQIVFRECPEALAYLKGKSITAEIPESFRRIFENPIQL